MVQCIPYSDGNGAAVPLASVWGYCGSLDAFCFSKIGEHLKTIKKKPLFFPQKTIENGRVLFEASHNEWKCSEMVVWICISTELRIILK